MEYKNFDKLAEKTLEEGFNVLNEVLGNRNSEKGLIKRLVEGISLGDIIEMANLLEKRILGDDEVSNAIRITGAIPLIKILLKMETEVINTNMGFIMELSKMIKDILGVNNRQAIWLSMNIHDNNFNHKNKLKVEDVNMAIENTRKYIMELEEVKEIDDRLYSLIMENLL